jgi:hypothetical protein
MNQTTHAPEFLQVLGRAVLDFGFMENTLRTLLIVVSRTEEAGSALVPPGNTVSQNLELLQRVCHLRIEPGPLEEWTSLIEDLRSLYAERNRIFHGIFYVQQDTLVLAKTKKGKSGAKDQRSEVAFDPASLDIAIQRLNTRRRQILDFLDDYASNDRGPPCEPSQDQFPSLRIHA